VLAWAETYQATAIVDDKEARVVGQQHKVDVHGSLWVISAAVRLGKTTAHSASAFVDQLLISGARYPFSLGGFQAWAEGAALL
jgi:predicted nucleic acid-binding protein